MNFKEFINERITHTPLPVIDPSQRNKPVVQKQLAKRSAAAVARTIPNQDLVKLQHANKVNASRTYYLTKAGVQVLKEEERVDEILPVLAAIGGGIARGAAVVGGGIARGAAGLGRAAKSGATNLLRKKAVNTIQQKVGNALAPEPANNVNASRTYYLTKAGAKFISEKVKDKTVPMLAKMIMTATNKRGSKVNPVKAISASHKAGVGSEVARTVKAAS